MTTSRVVVAVLWIGAGLWAADTRPAAPPAPPPSAAKAAPARPAAAPPARTATDAQLEAAIRARFAKSKIAVNKFQIHVQGGVATIEGRTEVIQHKGVATRMARNAGAAAVNNRVEISEAARRKAGGNLEQGRRRVQVKRGDIRSEARQGR
jgi:hypothetical protein